MMNITQNHTDPLFLSPPISPLLDHSQPILPTILCALVIYPIITAFLRSDRRRRTLRRYPYHDRSTFASMTDNDAQAIVRTLSQLEFPFTFEKALQFALFKSYGIPTVSKLMVATSQLTDPATVSKRYVDTELLIREWTSWSPLNKRGHKALARMNYIHSGYLKSGKLLEDDMLFTMASFVTEPVRWIAQYEWRPLEDFEICALAVFFKSAGDSMGISYRKLKSGEKGDWKDGLQWFEEIMEWTENYANDKMVPDINNKITADQTIAVLVWTIPSFLRPLAINLVKALMNERLRKAMMWVPNPLHLEFAFSDANRSSRYPAPAQIYFHIVHYVFAIRKFILRYLSPPRPEVLAVDPLSRTPTSEGRYNYLKYDAAPFYVKPTLWERIKPVAWLTWAMGLPLPGDQGDKFVPQGYTIEDIGPPVMVGKGGEYADKQIKEMQQSRTGGCPFGPGRGVKVPVGGNDLGALRWSKP